MIRHDKIESETSDQKITKAGTTQRQMRFTDEGVRTQYAGIFNIGLGSEEVVFIFGNHSVESNMIRVESKVAVSLKTAKRIAISLGNIIRRHELNHGEIDITTHHAEGEEKIQ